MKKSWILIFTILMILGLFQACGETEGEGQGSNVIVTGAGS